MTTVRDLANDVDELLARKKRIEDGTEIGTRIVMAGFMDEPGPYQGPTKVLVAEEKSGREWIDKYAALGMVQLKLYSSSRSWSLPSPRRRTSRACGCPGISRRVSPPAMR